MNEAPGPIEGGSPVAAALELVASARREPARLAVVDRVRALTVAAFEARVDGLAGAVSVGSPEPARSEPRAWLPIVVDRSVHSVVAIHAALRAGVPFALIDADLPASVIEDLWSRLGDPATAVVPTAARAATVPRRVSPVVAADAGDGTGHPPRPVDPAAPAVVLFTSGSTGRPKGVVRPWRSFDRILGDSTGARPESVLIGLRQGLFRPLHFAAALHSVVAPVAGSTLHLFDPSVGGVDELLAEVAEREIDSMDLAGGVAAALARAAGGVRRLPLVRAVTLGGDATTWELIAGLRSLAAPEVRVRVRYASSEAGGAASVDVGPGDALGQGTLPLGRGDALGRIRLVPLEPGSPRSQILVRDPLATGYLGDGRLTASRFVKDEAGVVWWASGDLASVDEAGLVHHQGRVDDLVKVNGVLVAPSEPEGVLREVRGIRDAVVVPDVTPAGRTRLVAHLCLDEPKLAPAAVRQHLRERLSGPRVPSVFVIHDRFPMTTTGKVDRAALASGPASPWGGAAHQRLPVGPLEWTLVGVCAELLELEDLGPDDDLWLMGLDSLAAVELCGIVAEHGLGHLEPLDLVGAPTAAALARRLSGERAPRETDVVEFNPDGSAAPVFAIPGAGSTALAFRSIARGLAPDHPVVVVEAHGLHGRGRPDGSLVSMATRARDEIEGRLGDRLAEECVVIGHSGGAVVAYEIAQQRAAHGRRTRVVMVDAAPLTDAGPAASGSVAGRPVGAVSLLARWRRAAHRLEGRSWREYPAIAGRQVRIARYRVWAGRPRADVLRYTAFGWRLQRYVRTYRADPPTFPCTVLVVARSIAGARAALLGPGVVSVPIGGNHGSCMQHPHVATIVGVLRDELARAATG